MFTAVRISCVLALIGVSGCGNSIPEGSELAARSFVASEFQKWMTGQENELETFHSKVNKLAPPIAYDVRSIVTDKPDMLAFDEAHGKPEDWRSWPAYRVNLAIEWKSEAGTPLEKINRYLLTWNANERKWYVDEPL